jgi:hypothetical protein
MPKKSTMNKAQKKAVQKYYKKYDFQGPLTEAGENQAYEQDMRRRAGSEQHHKPQRRVKKR